MIWQVVVWNKRVLKGNGGVVIYIYIYTVYILHVILMNICIYKYTHYHMCTQIYTICCICISIYYVM